MSAHRHNLVWPNLVIKFWDWSKYKEKKEGQETGNKTQKIQTETDSRDKDLRKVTETEKDREKKKVKHMHLLGNSAKLVCLSECAL